MKVFVVGAHGLTGQLIVQQLLDEGYQVIAGMRKESEFKVLPDSDDVKPILFDLLDDPKNIKQKFYDTGAEAIVFAAGANGANFESMALVDLDGAAKTIDAAKGLGINRYIMISGVGAWNTSMWEGGLKIYMIAKHYADHYLKEANLDYTIFYPSALNNNEGSGKIKIDAEDPYFKPTSRSNVAQCVVQALQDVHSIKKEYTIIDGKDEISNVI